jgi:hypothetical protein
MGQIPTPRQWRLILLEALSAISAGARKCLTSWQARLHNGAYKWNEEWRDKLTQISHGEDGEA